ncbi:MAG: pyridoxamine 5'-phosphate oxidase family protein [Proteobacteria bacterium]|nr:pyridoxamine 5'-phosphate oxidase family protein [Pseudomonadota bacterium]MBU4470531.1 pyridoxamine 5'-phosphate oxidase family protein [Pseudomonadota bacterium]MCG2751367.1 pyridoxamine 5'-phosphate oxidase family protein [Desulfobacteraceae bacterium]
MNLFDYFENTKGFGVLSTANSQGEVDAAIYARPHIMEDGTMISIMRDRLTHENLKTNSHAVYLFMEEGSGYKGKRLYLTKIREENNSELVDELCRRSYPKALEPTEEPRFVVYFRVDKVLPLVGSGK